jgi:CrcB protein
VTWLLVALGAAVGAPARYLLDRAVMRGRTSAVPWGILAVNVSGALALGLVAGADVGGDAVALLGIGLCGAFTTWSTLAVDVVALTRAGAWRTALLDLTLSIVAGLAAVSVGVELGRVLL